jgi:hypothetical protein
LQQQIRQLAASALFYFDLFFHQQGGLVVGVSILYLMSRWKSLRVTEIIQHWGLVIPSLAAFGMYALVYVEGRYLAVFCVLLWAELLANVSLPDSQASRRLVSLLSIIMILFMLMNIAAFNLEGMVNLTSSKSTTHLTNPKAGPPSWPGEVAEELHRLGVHAGDKVAVIGYAFDSFWARLARVKIVAEMLDQDAETFWRGDPSLRSEVLRAFANTGAKAIVAEYVPNYASMVNWHRVGNSNYYVYVIDSQ